MPYPIASTLARGSKGQLAASVPCYFLTYDAVPDDYIGLAGISLTGPFTVVAWIKRRVAGTLHGILGRASSTTSFFAIGADNTLTSRHGGGTQGKSTANASTDWVHCAWIEPAGVGNPRVYFRNGVDVSSVAGTSTGSAVTYTQLGRYNSANNFDGSIAYVGIAPGVLDIATMWSAGAFAGPLDPAVFSIACWNMRNEGGVGTTLADESASANNGTFKGAGEPVWGGVMPF